MKGSEVVGKSIKIKLSIMLIFIVAVYLPFFIYLMFRYDTVNTTLSRIGWRHDGLKFLLIYIFLTVPSLIYQIFLFLNLSGKKSTLLKSLILAGALLIGIGALFPVRETSPAYSYFLHSILCQIGGVLSISAVTYMIILYCKENKDKVKNVTILFGELFIIVVVTFGLLETAALFEVGSSFLFLVAMFVINGILLFEKEKEKWNIINQESANKIKYLEKGNKKGATIFASIFGSMAALIFCGGVSLVMSNPVAAVTEFIGGIVLGIVGLSLCAVNIPIYRKLVKRNTTKTTNV